MHRFVGVCVKSPVRVSDAVRVVFDEIFISVKILRPSMHCLPNSDELLVVVFL